MEALAVAEITFILVWGTCLISQVIHLDNNDQEDLQ
jgi:hypothetical protein